MELRLVVEEVEAMGAGGKSGASTKSGAGGQTYGDPSDPGIWEVEEVKVFKEGAVRGGGAGGGAVILDVRKHLLLKDY